MLEMQTADVNKTCKLHDLQGLDWVIMNARKVFACLSSSTGATSAGSYSYEDCHSTYFEIYGAF